MPPGINAILRLVRPYYVRWRERIGRAIFVRGADLRTEGVVMLDELGLEDPERYPYKATGWSILPRILPARSVSDRDVFIDYGSGMGRIVYEAAARYPFKRVIGLELSPELNEIAQANLDRNAERLRCPSVELVTADVLDFEPPPDITVAFFYNPFKGKVFETAVERLLDAARQPVRIIYFNPVEHEWLIAGGRVRVVRRLRGWRPSRRWSRPNSTVMYEYLP